MILILAQESDRTADGVVLGLIDRGEPVVRIDLSWFPLRLTLDAEFRDGYWRGSLCTEHHDVDLAAIRSVWVRSPTSFQLPRALSPVEADYSRREAKLGLGGVLFALPGVLWVNRPDLAARAGMGAEDDRVSRGGSGRGHFLRGHPRWIRSVLCGLPCGFRIQHLYGDRAS